MSAALALMLRAPNKHVSCVSWRDEPNGMWAYLGSQHSSNGEMRICRQKLATESRDTDKVHL